VQNSMSPIMGSAIFFSSPWSRNIPRHLSHTSTKTSDSLISLVSCSHLGQINFRPPWINFVKRGRPFVNQQLIRAVGILFLPYTSANWSPRGFAKPAIPVAKCLGGVNINLILPYQLIYQWTSLFPSQLPP
jgi:hypothetical protein